MYHIIVIISGPTAATLLFIVNFYLSPLRLVFKAFSQWKLKVRHKFAVGCHLNTLNSYVSMFLKKKKKSSKTSYKNAVEYGIVLHCFTYHGVTSHVEPNRGIYWSYNCFTSYVSIPRFLEIIIELCDGKVYWQRIPRQCVEGTYSRLQLDHTLY